MAAAFNAPIEDWHDCNYYCREDRHCDINITWYSGPPMGPDRGMQERFYRRYNARVLEVEPAKEFRPEEAHVPAGHTLADFNSAWLTWFKWPAK